VPGSSQESQDDDDARWLGGSEDQEEKDVKRKSLRYYVWRRSFSSLFCFLLCFSTGQLSFFLSFLLSFFLSCLLACLLSLLSFDKGRGGHQPEGRMAGPTRWKPTNQPTNQANKILSIRSHTSSSCSCPCSAPGSAGRESSTSRTRTSLSSFSSVELGANRLVRQPFPRSPRESIH